MNNWLRYKGMQLTVFFCHDYYSFYILVDFQCFFHDCKKNLIINLYKYFSSQVPGLLFCPTVSPCAPDYPSCPGHVFIVVSNLSHLEKCQRGRNVIQICQVVHKRDREGISVMYASNNRSCYGLRDFLFYFFHHDVIRVQDTARFFFFFFRKNAGQHKIGPVFHF